jgi:dipeptidyl aminopeptidase/acylaminoacyl peptidase
MTTERSNRFERVLPGLFDELADARTPDYLEAAIERASSRPQRPAWTFPERWLPMDVVTRSVPTPAFPWRQLGVLALIGLLIAAAVVAYVGSQPRLPEPFGPAGSGVIAYSVAGDIYTADPVTGAVTPLVTGPEDDQRPRFSRDGSMLAFERKVGGGDLRSHVYVVRADGSDLTRVTTEPVSLASRRVETVAEDLDFSPDGRSLLIPALTGLVLAQVDGTGTREVRLDGIGVAAYESSFRPPDGSEILFVGTDHVDYNGGGGLYAGDPVTGVVRTIVEPRPSRDIAMASWSPDGSRIAYTAWDPTAATFTARVHVVAADGTDDRVLPLPADAMWRGGAYWSNDGTRLLTLGSRSDGYPEARAIIVPADGSSTGTEVRYDGVVNGACCAVWEWAPDDSEVIGTPLDEQGRLIQQVIIDPVAGTAGPAPWTASDDPTWQRVAP